MLLFKFEDVLLTALGQQPGNTIWTYEQLSLEVLRNEDPTADLALSGDIMNSTTREPCDLWDELFGVSRAKPFFKDNVPFTKEREQAAVFREVRQIICAKYPLTRNNKMLLDDAIAFSLSFAFLVWIQQANPLIDFPQDSGLRLYQHLCTQNLAANTY